MIRAVYSRINGVERRRVWRKSGHRVFVVDTIVDASGCEIIRLIPCHREEKYA